ncbi:MAG: hypothetical protein AAF394_08380 [Planctomycetota bacterium]
MSLMTRLTAPVLLSMACLFSTGCMTSPGHLEHIGNRNDAVDFHGYGLHPNRWIKIEAKNPGSGVWETIGWARTGTFSYYYSGEEFYLWSTDIEVDDKYWTFFEERYFAEVRAVDLFTGDLMFTFDAGFYNYFDATESLGDLWMDHGHSTSVTIFAN